MAYYTGCWATIVRMHKPNGIKVRYWPGQGGKKTGEEGTNMKPTDDKGPEIRCRWDCAEVTRPLISTGVTCDSGYEVLHTKDAAMVVPAGALSSMLANINVVQRYTRSGNGLYTTKMKMRAPKIPASGFTRQSRQP